VRYVGEKIQKPKLESGSNEYKFRIPRYHKAAVGLFSGTKTFLTPLREHGEMVLTTIDPKNFGDVWRLEINLKDSPGSVHNITEILKGHGGVSEVVEI
jgi:hypothetical protein